MKTIIIETQALRILAESGIPLNTIDILIAYLIEQCHRDLMPLAPQTIREIAICISPLNFLLRLTCRLNEIVIEVEALQDDCR